MIAANADNGAPSVIQIHTNDPETKIPAEETILNQLPGDIAVSDLTAFARFWRARDRLVWTVKAAGGPAEIVLDVKSSEPVSGMTFEFAREIAGVDSGAALHGPHQVVLPDLAAGETLDIHVRYRS